ncbi:MAG: MFS transporter [Burkholderiales bacterium]|nr:MFS transporter [Burkholderiales bacterium]
MTADPARLPGDDPRRPSFGFMIGVLLAGQTIGTMGTTMIPAVAPKVAETYGISSALVGYQISLLALAMIVALAFGARFNRRWGSTRMQQIGLTLVATGGLIAILPHVAFFFLASIPLGLGYGTLTPSASNLLIRFTPEARRNLIFSLKQTGVPLGGIGAALITPAVAVAFGWQWAIAGNALVLYTLVLVMQHARPYWDDDREPAAKIGGNPFSSVMVIWRHPALRLLSLSGGCFVIVQFGITTFTVILFNEQLGWGLIEAGIVLTASQVGGVSGRLFWGWMADRIGDAFTALLFLGAVMVLSSLLCVLLTPGTPMVAACALFFVMGSTASGWNGAFLAEVARLVPRDTISTATGGSLVYVNSGKAIGPIVFANVALLTGNYALTFALLAVPAAAGLWCLWAAHRGSGTR